MKTFTLWIILSLCLFGRSASFAGGTACETNTPPVMSFLSVCDSQFVIPVGTPFNITGNITDNLGDIVTVNATGIPISASTTPSLPTSGNFITLIFSWTPGQTDVGSTYNVILVATDLCGATAYCAFTIHVVCAPVLIFCPADTSVQPSIGQCSSAVVLFGVTAMSLSGISELTVTPPAGSTFPAGTTTVTATAKNNCGDSTSCSFNVTVEAPAPPNIFCPSDITAVATTGPPCVANVIFGVGASSQIGIASLVVTPPAGTPFPVGKTTVTATATDICGGVSTCSFDVTVDPAPPPQLPCNISITMPTIGCEATMSVTLSTIGGVQPVVVTYDPPTGTVLEPGITTVTATATDACGSTSSCSFPLTVLPREIPIIHCPPDITVAASSGSCSAIVNYGFTLDDFDPGDDIEVDIPSGSIFPLGTTTVHARVTDECGDGTSCSFTVTVTSDLTVNAGPDVSTVFGYPSTQTATNTAVASGGTGPYSYSWTLNRALKCNQVNSTGDELFTGGSCSNNICPGTGTATAAAPSCSSSASISATLLADAIACVTVTDANGCTATDCFNISAVDGRCFSGNSGKKKTKVCHHTNSPTNPWIQICVDKGALAAHLANNRGDYVGPCITNGSRTAFMEEEESFLLYPNPVGSALTLDFGSGATRTVQLYNTIGAILFETTTDWEQMIIDMTNYPKGIYFISVRDEDNTLAVKKFVKM